MKIIYNTLILLLSITIITACNNGTDTNEEKIEMSKQTADIYKEVRLGTDLSYLTLFEVGQIMDDIFWKQAFGEKDEFLNSIKDSKTKLFAEINYGPWDRLSGNQPFIEGYGSKPLGANFYPKDMTKEEFESFEDKNKDSQYTLIRRDENGNLKSVWYHEAFAEETNKAAELLKKASELAEDEGLKKYLEMRAEALLTDDYQESDFVWMDMKSSIIDLVVGPIENYEDKLFGTKAAHEMFILVKDVEWSNRLAKFTQFLPQMQKDMPVADTNKKHLGKMWI